VLWVLALVAVAAYYNFGGFHQPGWIHHWEQFHYQLGSKYFPELGYDGLYAASLTAQTESRPDVDLQPWARDLRTNRVELTQEILAHGREVKERFTPARWREFSATTITTWATWTGATWPRPAWTTATTRPPPGPSWPGRSVL
jgi:hypothetical protein